MSQNKYTCWLTQFSYDDTSMRCRTFAVPFIQKNGNHNGCALVFVLSNSFSILSSLLFFFFLSRDDVTPKPKPKKKGKKAKFKSLKKGALVSKSICVKEESSIEPMSVDDDFYDDTITSSDALSPCLAPERKRKPASDDEEQRSKKKSKKSRASEAGNIHKSSGKHQDDLKDLKICDNGFFDSEKQLSRNRARGKLSIPIMPLKRVFTIKPEKLKKKGNIWSKDFIPSPDLWSPKEDATLCASIHEYGPNWFLASEILYGMSDGGSYRGRFRHPVHCSERLRELLQRYVFSVSDATNNDKAVGVGSGKGPLRVTEVC